MIYAKEGVISEVNFNTNFRGKIHVNKHHLGNIFPQNAISQIVLLDKLSTSHLLMIFLL